MSAYDVAMASLLIIAVIGGVAYIESISGIRYRVPKPGIRSRWRVMKTGWELVKWVGVAVTCLAIIADQWADHGIALRLLGLMGVGITIMSWLVLMAYSRRAP